MRVSTLLPSLVAVAAATEIRFTAEEKCGGPYVACSDIDSTTCCVPGDFAAHSAQFIDTPVVAIIVAFQKNDTIPACTPRSIQAGQVTNAGSVDCLGFFTDGVGSARWKEYTGGKGCKSTQLVDVFVLGANTKYSLKGMTDGMQHQLFEGAGKGLLKREELVQFEEFRM